MVVQYKDRFYRRSGESAPKFTCADSSCEGRLRAYTNKQECPKCGGPLVEELR